MNRLIFDGNKYLSMEIDDLTVFVDKKQHPSEAFYVPRRSEDTTWLRIDDRPDMFSLLYKINDVLRNYYAGDLS